MQEQARPGPRPRALHLATAIGAWQSSKLGLPLLKSDCALPLTPALEQLRQRVGAAPLPDLLQALDAEIAGRSDALARGLELYRQHPHRRQAQRRELVWRDGTTRLWDYGPDDCARPLLLVPSLINRADILDLDAESGLCRWLATQGLRPFLVDWDAPAEAERAFTLTDYICGRLVPAADAVAAMTASRPTVLGYCLGGLLALGLAQQQEAKLAGLALLATPWDFHADPPVPPSQVRLAAQGLGPVIDQFGALPLDALQTLFFWLDPWQTIRKFMAFAGKDQDSPGARAFVALEDWLNDGVDLAAPVAREVLLGWYGENRPARGLWRLAGRPLLPEELTLPSLLIVPGADRIVPPASAGALAKVLTQAEVLQPAAGHIGMVVGSRAKRQVWAPLRDWTLALPT
ncbi:MAG: alpha/beta fold hydrolase [Rhodospirillales bacterium]